MQRIRRVRRPPRAYMEYMAEQRQSYLTGIGPWPMPDGRQAGTERGEAGLRRKTSLESDDPPPAPDVDRRTIGVDRRTTPRFGRSRQMADCLRGELLYSEKKPRNFLFRVIEEIVSERCADPMILSRLTREAAARARR